MASLVGRVNGFVVIFRNISCITANLILYNISNSFHKTSEYIITSFAPFSEKELFHSKQNLPTLPFEAVIELCHLKFALIHFHILFLQIISSTKS